MSVPNNLNLSADKRKSVLAIFRGSSRKFEKTQSARKIAEVLEVPRRQVMLFLETYGHKEYSEGTYQ